MGDIKGKTEFYRKIISFNRKGTINHKMKKLELICIDPYLLRHVLKLSVLDHAQ